MFSGPDANLRPRREAQPAEDVLDVLMADSDRPLDRSIVKTAIRQADLRLVHHADSQRLADLLGGVED